MATAPSLISLFSGAGGLDVGLERAGWQTLVATDQDPHATASLEASRDRQISVRGRTAGTHLGGTRILRANVHDLTAADLRPRGVKRTWRPSLLAGGPPCQPWSSAGLQKGFTDPRGMLIAQMIRLTSELRPRFVLMENVRGLLTASGPGGHHGEAIEQIQAEWENLGYAVRWQLLNAADFGAAQRRVRMFMIASATHEPVDFPAPTHSRTPSSDEKPWVSLGEFISGLPTPLAADIVTPSGKRVAELLDLRPGTGIKTGGTVEHQRPSGHWGYRQDSFLADLQLPSRTIRAAATPDWVRPPGQVMRRLTWRECAALQGFPPDWHFGATREARFRLIGNAVQADVAAAIGEVLLSAIARGPSVLPPTSPPWPVYFHRRITGARADHRANAASRRRRTPSYA